MKPTSASTETIGQRIQRLRKEAGRTQRSLAGPGVSYPYVSLIERDKRRPSVRALRVIARNLETTPEYLETGVDLSERELRDLRLSEAEVQLRLTDEVEQAAEKLRVILRQALEASDRPAATRARSALGLAAAHQGAHREAIELLESVIGEAGIAPETHPDLYLSLGRSYLATTQSEQAIELWERCLGEVERWSPTNTGAYVRVATALSSALSDQGNLADAQAVLKAALEHAGHETDPYTQIRRHWSQARLALGEEDYGAAQASMWRAVGLLETAEDSFGLGRAHLLYAELSLSAGNSDQAGEHVELAAGLLGNQAERRDRSLVLIVRGKLAARLGQGVEAIRLGEQALALLGRDDPGFCGRAHGTIGEGLAAEGEIDRASEHFRQAEELLDDENRASIQVLEAWGNLLHDAGRHEEAYAMMARAVRRVRTIQAPESGS